MTPEGWRAAGLTLGGTAEEPALSEVEGRLSPHDRA